MLILQSFNDRITAEMQKDYEPEPACVSDVNVKWFAEICKSPYPCVEGMFDKYEAGTIIRALLIFQGHCVYVFMNT